VAAWAATRPAAQQEAIDWLLSEVKGSDAVFIRNGSEYNGEKAAAHLKSKLFFAGKRVQTARQFIVGVASHSETSGKPYEIQAKDGVREPLEKWLLERLAVFEKGKAAAH
jgi:NAD(P)H-dependent FMN reductase